MDHRESIQIPHVSGCLHDPLTVAIIYPPAQVHPRDPPNVNEQVALNPPSFRDSQFAIVLRRQRLRPADNSGLKTSNAYPSRFINLSNSFEFAGWGSVTRLKLRTADHAAGVTRIEATKKSQVLGQFTASALAGNAVLGSVFYALPAVVAVGGI